MSKATYLLESREHLVNLLAEAAEVEHNLMCCYLYAAFSLKEGRDEDLTEEELAAVTRWRRTILRVSIEEMVHLALVANLTSAIGGTPHFGRPNFPVPSGYLPAGMVLKLARFDLSTIDHFIYLERPADAEVEDGAGFVHTARYSRIPSAGRLMPSSHDYETVGDLYRAIREGLEHLSRVMGEPTLFLGDPSHQIGPDDTMLPGVVRVRCLRTALEALDAIVAQGEGAPGHSEGSHFARFVTIREELLALTAARPSFVPSRPAAENPVMRTPVTDERRVFVALEPAARVLDLVNAAYIHMLRLLVQAYAETRGDRARRAFVDASTDLMRAITPAASALTRWPANEAFPGCNAGMTFATVRSSCALPTGVVADRVLVDRMHEIVQRAELVGATTPHLEGVAPALSRVVARLSRELAAVAASTAAPATAPTATTPATPRPIPIPMVEDGVETVEGQALTLRFDNKRCIHARFCVLGQPAVFKANVKGPWLDPDATGVEDLVAVAHLCPSGAIQYTRKDGVHDEAPPHVNLVQVRENGPLAIRADIALDDAGIGYRATLCRCGASKRKPYCDGSHASIGFTASGEPATRTSEPLAARNGLLDIRPQRNGPLSVRGNIEIISGTGRTIDRMTSAVFCRCGQSAQKPFCDGSHARVGFEAD